MNQFFLVSGCVLATTLGALAQAPTAEHDMTLSWRAGKRYTLDTETTTTMGLEPLGRIGDQVLQVKQSTSIAVTAGPQEGWKQAEVTVQSVAATMREHDSTFTFDSTKPGEGNPDLSAMLSKLAGQSFVLQYDDKDQFQRVADLAKSASGGEGNASLVNMATAEQMAELFRRSLEMGLPKVPVAPGDTWTSDEQLEFPRVGKVRVKMNCKFDSLVDREGRPHAKIIFDSKLSEVGGDRDGVRGKNGMDIGFGEGSTIAGHVFFDLERHTVSLSVFLANLTLRLDELMIPVRQNVTMKMSGWVNLEPAR